MKKICTLLFVILIVLSVNAQKPQYYEFGWNGLYGIVNSKGEEVLKPTYGWVFINFRGKSEYLVLNSYDDGAYAINRFTGESELFISMINYVINIKDKEYTYAYTDQQAMFINNSDFKDRIVLPKAYSEFQQEGDYLIGIDYLDEGMSVDLLSKSDFSVKLKGLDTYRLSSYKREAGGNIYVVKREHSTEFLDDSLKRIGVVNKELDSFDKLSKYLKTTKNIEIVEEEYEMETATIGPPPNYPFIRESRGLDNEGYMVFNLYESRDNYYPFFKLKREDVFKTSVQLNRYKNILEVRNKLGKNREKMYYLFYTDTQNKRILFPQKYWEEIGLQMIKE